MKKENYSKLERLIPVLQVNIWRHSVNVYTNEPFLIPYIESIRSKEEDYGIPGFSTANINNSNPDYCNMLVTNGKNSEIIWLPKEYVAVIKVKPKNVKTIDKEVAYKSLSVTEHMRQLDGQLLSNGVASTSPNGKGVILFGKRAHGKTTTLLLLCKKYGHRLVAGDQVIFGFNNEYIADERLWLFEGTKYVTLRSAIAQRYFPEYSKEFKQGKFWDDKVNLREDKLNVELSKNPVPIHAAFLINLDYDERVPLSVKDAGNDLETSLFLAEVTSRHITGICSPLLDENEAFLNLCPSFDTKKTRKMRQKIIKHLVRTPMYKISAGNPNEVTNFIDKTLKFGG